MSLDKRVTAFEVFEQVWVRQHFGFADEVVSPHCRHHFFDDLSEVQVLSGPAGYKRLAQLFRQAFPDAAYWYAVDQDEELLVH